jgi:hypothetical protein
MLRVSFDLLAELAEVFGLIAVVGAPDGLEEAMAVCFGFRQQGRRDTASEPRRFFHSGRKFRQYDRDQPGMENFSADSSLMKTVRVVGSVQYYLEK